MRSTAYIVPTYHISSFPYQSFHKLYIHILYDIYKYVHIYIYIYTTRQNKCRGGGGVFLHI